MARHARASVDSSHVLAESAGHSSFRPAGARSFRVAYVETRHPIGWIGAPLHPVPKQTSYLQPAVSSKMPQKYQSLSSRTWNCPPDISLLHSAAMPDVSFFFERASSSAANARSRPRRLTRLCSFVTVLIWLLISPCAVPLVTPERRKSWSSRLCRSSLRNAIACRSPPPPCTRRSRAAPA